LASAATAASAMATPMQRPAQCLRCQFFAAASASYFRGRRHL